MVLGQSQLHHSHRADLYLRGEDCTGCGSGEATFWAISEPCYSFLHYLLSSWSSAPGLITFPVVVARLSDKNQLRERRAYFDFLLEGTVHRGKGGVVGGAGGRITIYHSQEVEKNECWPLACFSVFIPSGTPAHGIEPATSPSVKPFGQHPHMHAQSYAFRAILIQWGWQWGLIAMAPYPWTWWYILLFHKVPWFLLPVFYFKVTASCKDIK